MPTIQVGVSVIISRNNNVLLGRRLSKHGHDTWGFPGGHLEFGETVEACAKRECLEETGLELTNIRQLTFTEDFFETGKHYITLFVTGDNSKAEPQVLEPEKCAEWRWFSWNHLPQPLFLPVQNLVKDKNFLTDL